MYLRNYYILIKQVWNLSALLSFIGKLKTTFPESSTRRHQWKHVLIFTSQLEYKKETSRFLFLYFLSLLRLLCLVKSLEKKQNPGWKRTSHGYANQSLWKTTGLRYEKKGDPTHPGNTIRNDTQEILTDTNNL